MHGNCSDIDLWILKELRLLGISIPKLKKIRIQIQKKNEKGKPCGTFGVCLAKLLTSDNSCTVVPTFLEKMTSFLSSHVTRNCIFRKNGNKDRMRHLQAQLEMGHDVLTDASIEDAAGILKSWFRDLPVSLIPDEFHDFFISCHKVCEASCSSKALLLACSLLPSEHLSTLKYILEFLSSVAKHSAVNKMSSKSLAIVFAPNFMPIASHRKIDKSLSSIEAIKEKQELSQNVVQWLIEHSEEVKNTPESVAFLAQLSAESSNKTDRKKRTKRRKSMCDIVGVKIKKLVAPNSDGIQVDRPKGNPVLKHKVDCKSAHPEVPLKRSKKLSEDISTENFLGKSDSETEMDNILPRSASLKSMKHNAAQDDIVMSSNSGKPASTCSIEKSKESEDGKENLVTTIFVQPSSVSVSSIMFVTPTKDVDSKADKPRSTLKRGRPNTVNSGLKDRRKANLRGSTSLENLILPFEQLEVSRRISRSASSIFQSFEDPLQLISSPPQNIDAITTIFVNDCLSNLTSVSTSHDMLDSKHASKSDLSISVNRVLDFFNTDQEFPLSSSSSLSDLSCKTDSINSSPVSGTYPNTSEKSLGVSPILNSSTESDKGNKTKESQVFSLIIQNDSRNPFQDITNDSEIPTLNSSIGDNSFFSTSEVPNNNINCPPSGQKSFIKSNFATPSPIISKTSRKTNGKSSITASSTPANDLSQVSWKSARDYNFSKDDDDKLAEPKRESIIKLKETNAGKVLANIKLYNNKLNEKQARSLQSPSSRRNVFERNGLATKSVRERSKQLFEHQGFKVPSVCPSSIKRISHKAKVIKSYSAPEEGSKSSPCLETIANILKDPFEEISKSSSLSIFKSKCTLDLNCEVTDTILKETKCIQETDHPKLSF